MLNISFSHPSFAQEIVQAGEMSDSEIHDYHTFLYALKSVASSSCESAPGGYQRKHASSFKKTIVQYLLCMGSFDNHNIVETAQKTTLPLKADLSDGTLQYWGTTMAQVSAFFSSLDQLLSFPAAAGFAIPQPGAVTAGRFVFECRTSSERDDFFDLLSSIGEAPQDAAHTAMLRRVIQERLADKELTLALLPPEKIKKRASLSQMREIDQRANAQYVANRCRIRTKTNQGTSLGDNILVVGEVVRNPIRAVADKIYQDLYPGEQMPQTGVTLTEIGNALESIVFGVFTYGAYPIVKYASAKAMNVVGHVKNGDWRCAKGEFSAEQMANLLFDTEVGMTDRFAFHQTVPAKLSGAEAFEPEGLFVQENMSTGIHTEKYMSISRDGEEILIKEISPGQYVTHHPQASHPEEMAQPVFFDQQTQRIFFDERFPAGQGYDFKMIDGKQFISLHEKNYELQYEKNTGRPEIAVTSEGETVFLPAFREKLSGTWHVDMLDPLSAIRRKQAALIDRVKLRGEDKYTYHPTEHVNRPIYGSGKIYEVRPPGKSLSDTPSLRVIEMYGELVPLRWKRDIERGDHYEIYDVAAPDKAGRSVGWEGGRWRFKNPSSLHVAKSVKDVVSADMFDKNVSADYLSVSDKRGIRWDSQHHGFLKIKNGMVRIRSYKKNEHAFFIRHDRKNIKLSFHNKQFHLETLAQRLHKLRTQGLSGRGAVHAAQTGFKKRTATEIIANTFYMDEAKAEDYLGQYRFPPSGMHDELNFALEIEGYGEVPVWAERYRRRSPEGASGATGQLDVAGSSGAHGESENDFDVDRVVDGAEEIGAGLQGVVFQDPTSELFVIKRLNAKGYELDPRDTFPEDMEGDDGPVALSLEKRREMADREAAVFEHYYGEGSARVFEREGNVYLRMRKAPGEAVEDIEPGTFPEDAVERYVDMLEKMNDQGIMHGDLNPGNVLYDKSSNMFYPIDFSNYREKFFHGDAQEKVKMNQWSEDDWNTIMGFINPHEQPVLGAGMSS